MYWGWADLGYSYKKVASVAAGNTYLRLPNIVRELQSR